MDTLDYFFLVLTTCGNLTKHLALGSESLWSHYFPLQNFRFQSKLRDVLLMAGLLSSLGLKTGRTHGQPGPFPPKAGCWRLKGFHVWGTPQFPGPHVAQSLWGRHRMCSKAGATHPPGTGKQSYGPDADEPADTPAGQGWTLLPQNGSVPEPEARRAGASHRPVGSGPRVIRATSGFWKVEPGDPKSHHLLDNEGQTK